MDGVVWAMKKGLVFLALTFLFNVAWGQFGLFFPSSQEMNGAIAQQAQVAGQFIIGEYKDITSAEGYTANLLAVDNALGPDYLSLHTLVDDTIESTLIVEPDATYDISGDITQVVTGQTLQVGVHDSPADLWVALFSDDDLGPFLGTFTAPTGVFELRLLIGSASGGTWVIKDFAVTKQVAAQSQSQQDQQSYSSPSIIPIVQQPPPVEGAQALGSGGWLVPPSNPVVELDSASGAFAWYVSSDEHKLVRIDTTAKRTWQDTNGDEFTSIENSGIGDGTVPFEQTNIDPPVNKVGTYDITNTLTYDTGLQEVSSYQYVIEGVESAPPPPPPPTPDEQIVLNALPPTAAQDLLDLQDVVLGAPTAVNNGVDAGLAVWQATSDGDAAVTAELNGILAETTIKWEQIRDNTFNDRLKAIAAVNADWTLHNLVFTANDAHNGFLPWSTVYHFDDLYHNYGVWAATQSTDTLLSLDDWQ